MAISVLCLFLMVSWVGLHCVIVAFLGHTHLLFNSVTSVYCVSSSCTWYVVVVFPGHTHLLSFFFISLVVIILNLFII